MVVFLPEEGMYVPGVGVRNDDEVCFVDELFEEGWEGGQHDPVSGHQPIGAVDLNVQILVQLTSDEA